MSYTLTAEDMGALNTEHKTAIVAAVVASALADGSINPDEISKFDAEFSKVPWGLPEMDVDNMIRAAHGKITALKDAKEVIDFIAATSENIPTAVREKVFAIICSVAYADKKMNEQEMAIITCFAAAFKIPRERLADIAAEVKKA